MSVPPNFIFLNGKIHTMADGHEEAEAIAITGGRISAIGRNKDLERLSGPNTVKIDLKKRTVLPGFIDTHTHLETVARNLLNVNLKTAKSIEEVLKIIEQSVPEEPGKWITSSWWHPYAQLREKRLPTKFEIDKVSPNNPTLLFTVGHTAIANSRALEIAGIDESMPDPEGGRIDRDPLNGQLTGILYESAIRLVEKYVPPPTYDKLLEKYRQTMASFNRAGLTSIVTGATTPQELEIWKGLRCSKEDMTLRVNISYLPTGEEVPLGSEEEFDSALADLKQDFSSQDRFLSLGCIKIVLDGGMTLGTAAVSKPYPDDPKNFGILTMDQQRLNRFVSICNNQGHRVGIHAVGDRAIDAVLSAYKEADKERAIGGRRFLLIHGFLIRPDQIAGVAKLGILIAVQNGFMYEKACAVEKFLDEKRINQAIPTRLLIDGGITVTGGSDADVNSFNPFLGVYQAVTRKSREGKVFGASQRVSRREAFSMYTKWAAMQTFEEQYKGSLAPGKLADLIVTSSDVFACPEEEIKEIKVIMTMVGGRIVYASHDIMG